MKTHSSLSGFKKIFIKLAASERWQRLIFALLSTLLILVFVKIPVERYKIEMDKGIMFQHTQHGFYAANDIDGDGSSERINIYRADGSGRVTLKVNRSNGAIEESFWFMGYQWEQGSTPSFIDLDFDGIKEVVFVGVKNDSVFLNALNTVKNERVIDELFIGEIENKVEQLGFVARIIAFDDYNKDGEFELYFWIDSGYGFWPRGFFRYDFKSRILRKSPKAYILWSGAVFSDINGDGLPEILPTCSAPSNIHFETRYSDNNPWIAAFDLDLNYLFEPIALPVGYGSCSTDRACFNDTLIIAFYNNLSGDADYNEIFILNNKGKIIKSRKVFRDDPVMYSQILIRGNNKNFLFIKNTGKFEINAELEGLPEVKTTKQRNYKHHDLNNSWILDADQDGKPETLFYDAIRSKIEIKNGETGEASSVAIPFDGLLITGIYPIIENLKVTRLMVALNKGYFFINYFKNKNYWTKYIIWLGIFITSYTITFLIQFTQRHRMEQKWETEKQLTELQFNTIRNQLNPHFIFNALNSVGYLIENGQKEEAYDYLSINVRLIRKVLDDAELTTRSLEEEIKFVKDYLAIQEFRFKDRYGTVFSIDENVNLNLPVPKMVLHTYVENSVKHGFKNTYKDGLLEISVTTLPKGVRLKVCDNGNFSKEADHDVKNTGKGLGIMESYYRLFEKQHNCVIKSSIIHLNEKDNALTGTEAEVRIEYL